MSHSYEGYESFQQMTVAEAAAKERIAFLRKTYGHLVGAIFAFVIVEMLIFMALAPTQERAAALIGPLLGNRVTWLLILGAFIFLGWVARAWAHSTTSKGLQYAGLALYVVGEAAIFFPLLCIVTFFVPGGYDILFQAALLTFLVFGGLSAGVFITGKDFSFLGPIIGVATMLALGIIVGGIFFGFHLGLWFSVAMVGLACAAILYTTSNILHYYPTTAYVAAALELFASVALLFWYILQIFLASRD